MFSCDFQTLIPHYREYIFMYKMVSIWFTSELADEIMRSDDIFSQTQNVITGKSHAMS